MINLNLLDSKMFQAGVPHETFRKLRETSPVSWCAESDGPGFWAITKHADIVTISRNPELFVSGQGTLIKDSDPDRLILDRQSMLNMDPPQHGEYRSFVRRCFQRHSNNLDDAIARAVNRILDNIAPLGTCDFASQISAELPMQVVAEMMDAHWLDFSKFSDWNLRLMKNDNPEGDDGVLKAVATEMHDYAKQQALENGIPNMDLVDTYLNSEMHAHFLLNCVAGNEPTRNFISGAFIALLENPLELNKLLTDTEPWPRGIEELCRYVTPAMYFRRTAAEDTYIRGQKISAGDKLALYYISGNRDEEVFEAPDSLDVGRNPNPHLAMGVGEHICIGSMLGRREAQILFKALFLRFPDVEICAEYKRIGSTFMNGYTNIPIRYTVEGIAK